MSSCNDLKVYVHANVDVDESGRMLPRSLVGVDFIMNDHIFTQAERLRKKYRTRDPYEALEEMNVVVMYSNAFARDGLKGFCTIQNQTKYVVIN